jgi:hypothetical protein
VLRANAMKPLHVALSELDRGTAAHFVFEYFARVRRVSLSFPLFVHLFISLLSRSHRTLRLMDVASSMEVPST